MDTSHSSLIPVFESTSPISTMSSREVAELTGKRHADVLRDIDKLVEALNADLRLGFKSSTYKDSTGKENRMYSMDRDSSVCLVSGYDANARMIIIKRWQELETAQAKTITPAELMLQQAQMIVAHERRMIEHEDRLKRIECKQQAFEDGIRYFTVIGYVGYKGLPTVNMTQAQKLGKIAKKLSSERNILTDKVRDPRFGNVGSYHESVLDDAYSMMLECAE